MTATLPPVPEVAVDVAIEALRDFDRLHPGRPADLARYAQICRVSRVMHALPGRDRVPGGKSNLPASAVRFRPWPSGSDTPPAKTAS